MDIDDILASVDRGAGASPESAALDHQQLTRFWVAERAVSEVLPWPAPLMERMMDRVRIQIETIEDLAASSADTDVAGTAHNHHHNPNLNLRLSILQTDLARTQYIIRSLLRQRLAKLTKHSMHYLVQLASRNKNPLTAQSQSQSQSQTPSSNSPNAAPEDSVPDISALADFAPLSEPETSFVHAHQTLLAGHYGGSFMGAFPRQLRRLDDNAGGTSMVQGPETKEVVFVRCLGAEVPVFVGGDDGDGGDEIGITMRMGDVWVVRWEGVRKAWGKGEVELL
ncbi:DNA replication complex GINS protein SLD5 [Penicillium canariense]|uniref:DNA replication complex GINS protein SLD5 n=1 Tax=Penicillium canariense TaxID=189055 RepID=A0A9W9LKL9_9EURO|nr:DNA replication complex GINS protein SLD5 [Penicillium canariense]KAJ5160803.1 DNA replication complex GINS protein SLD5 [Penicillium canariense]